MNLRIKRKRFRKRYKITWMPKRLHLEDIKAAALYILEEIRRVLDAAILYGWESEEQRKAQKDMDVFGFKTVKEHHNEIEYKAQVICAALQITDIKRGRKVK